MISFKLEDGDFILGGDGHFVRVSGVELLKQKIKKILSTNKENVLNFGEIPFRYNPNYGTDINYIRQLMPIFTIEDARKAIQTEIRNVILNYANIQSYTFRYGLSPDEMLSDATVIANVIVDNTAVKRVIIMYEVELVTASGRTETLEGELTSPLGG